LELRERQRFRERRWRALQRSSDRFRNAAAHRAGSTRPSRGPPLGDNALPLRPCSLARPCLLKTRFGEWSARAFRGACQRRPGPHCPSWPVDGGGHWTMFADKNGYDSCREEPQPKRRSGPCKRRLPSRPSSGSFRRGWISCSCAFPYLRTRSTVNCLSGAGMWMAPWRRFTWPSRSFSGRTTSFSPPARTRRWSVWVRRMH
jgi:hypothetical protein